MILILLLILIVLSFFFSISETAIIGLNKIRLRHMIARGIKGAKKVQQLLIKLDNVIAAVLIGNNFVNIAISAICTAIFVQILGYRTGIVVSTFAVSFFILIVCEITPKIIATKYSERIALFSAPLMEFFLKIFNPFVLIFMKVSTLILRILRIKPPKRSPLLTEEEFRTMIEIGKEEGVLSDEERGMLHRIFEFGDTKVSEVMVPKEKIVGISRNVSSEELINVFVEEGHARLPVYEGTIDNIVGIIYAHDLLYILRDKKLFVLDDLIHDACFVSAKTRVNELLKRFQAEKVQIAIVVDENKKAVGLVTLEDLIEEIVGEIEERHKGRHSRKIIR